MQIIHKKNTKVTYIFGLGRALLSLGGRKMQRRGRADGKNRLLLGTDLASHLGGDLRPVMEIERREAAAHRSTSDAGTELVKV